MARTASRIYVSPVQRLARINVLLLDNDSRIVDLMANVMRTLGFEALHRARDGYEGVALMRKQPIDLVITDWDLQPMRSEKSEAELAALAGVSSEALPSNGAAFVRGLRRSKNSPSPFVPVIMLTGPTLPDNIRYARDAGVNEVLMKPIVAEDLCARIVEIVERPRDFITSESYKGPCRRRRNVLLDNQPERRKATIKIIKCG